MFGINENIFQFSSHYSNVDSVNTVKVNAFSFYSITSIYYLGKVYHIGFAPPYIYTLFNSSEKNHTVLVCATKIKMKTNTKIHLYISVCLLLILLPAFASSTFLFQVPSKAKLYIDTQMVAELKFSLKEFKICRSRC